jgi:hypothetical protein
MPYSSYNYQQIEAQLGLQIKRRELFPLLEAMEFSDWLKESLRRGQLIPPITEKAKSEVLIAPVLLELVEQNKDKITLYSGAYLNVDEEKNLNGECDYVIGLTPDGFLLDAPILALVEAKKELIDIGTPQCIAQMYGAKLFNEQEGRQLKSIYGCVCTGTDWRFLQLIEDTIYINTTVYTDIGLVLSALQYIIDKSSLIKQ